jgi:hypothetical protein
LRMGTGVEQVDDHGAVFTDRPVAADLGHVCRASRYSVDLNVAVLHLVFDGKNLGLDDVVLLSLLAEVTAA